MYVHRHPSLHSQPGVTRRCRGHTLDGRAAGAGQHGRGAARLGRARHTPGHAPRRPARRAAARLGRPEAAREADRPSGPLHWPAPLRWRLAPPCLPRPSGILPMLEAVKLYVHLVDVLLQAPIDPHCLPRVLLHVIRPPLSINCLAHVTPRHNPAPCPGHPSPPSPRPTLAHVDAQGAAPFVQGTNFETGLGDSGHAGTSNTPAAPLRGGRPRRRAAAGLATCPVATLLETLHLLNTRWAPPRPNQPGRGAPAQPAARRPPARGPAAPQP